MGVRLGSAVRARAPRARAHRRRGRARRATALAPLLVELAPDALALELGKVVDEQLAFEMIHLVLQAHRQQALELPLERAPVPVLRAHANARGALDLS